MSAVLLPALLLAASLAPALAADDGPGWESKLYAEPRVGGFLFSSGGTTRTGATLGAEAGLRYWQVQQPPPRWRGRTRVTGHWVLATGDVSGLEARLGSFIGPRWKWVGLEAGPDLFWNRYELGASVLDPSLGVGVPLTATVGKGQGLSAYGGVEPAWLADEDRRVDWSQTDIPGFGHEFTWRVGVGLTVDGLHLGLGYSWRVTAIGDQHGLSVGIDI